VTGASSASASAHAAPSAATQPPALVSRSTPPLTPAATRTVATTTTPHPASAGGGSDQSVSGLILGLLLSGAVVAAVVNIVLTRRNSLEEERNRVRTTCAEAFEAVAAYKEFPYAIRRRRDDQAAAERVRLSDELRHIQARLSYFTAWMRGENAALGAAFDELVTNLRRIAGVACHDAWLAPAATSDAQMNFAPGVVDLTGLATYEDAYISAVKAHLDGLIKTRRIVRLRSR
jgi:hypothetical protein